MWILFISICLGLSDDLIALAANTDHYQSNGDQLFDFGIFENFVANGEIFRAEVQILKRLQRFKMDLSLVSKAVTCGTDVGQHLVRKLESVRPDSIVHQNLFVNSSTQDPIAIIKGACNGLVQLQSTYDLDTDRMAEGYISGSGFVLLPIIRKSISIIFKCLVIKILSHKK